MGKNSVCEREGGREGGREREKERERERKREREQVVTAYLLRATAAQKSFQVDPKMGVREREHIKSIAISVECR